MTEYGLQMYSVRDLAKEDLRAALKEVALLGYKYIEFAGFFDNTAENVKMWLDEFGLICSGTHTSIADLAPEKIEKTIEFHKIIGCDNIIVPGMKHEDDDVLDLQIARLNYADKILKASGIRLGYHNHSKEFWPNFSGKIVEDEIIGRTSVEIEIDTFWAYNAGIDVLSFLNENKERISVIHLKDGLLTRVEDRLYEQKLPHSGATGKSLGQGEAPVTLFRRWALDNGVRMVVESEGLDPTGIEEVGRCMEFLRSLD